jgi:ABC-type lipoprotein release transport system permease subunit
MWMILTSRWRRRLGTQLVLAATIALAGGAVLACVAGARRTASADDRFVAEAKMPDAAIDLEPIEGLSIEAQIEAISNLPQVAGWARVANYAVIPTATSEEYQIFFAPLDDGLGVEVMKPRYIEGRAPEAADEISMDENRAELIGLELGDTVPAVAFTPAEVETLDANEGRMEDPPAGLPMELRLVGIERTPRSIASDLDIASITTASRAFAEKYGDEIGMVGELLFVDLEPGEGVDTQFAREVQDILGSPQAIEGGGEGTGNVGSTLGFVARALAIVAAIMAFAGLVAIFAVMLRLSAAGQDEHEVLDAIGVGPSTRRRANALESGPGAIAGVLGAVVVAAAVSPLFPFGLAGRAEPHPGFDLDPLVLVVGGLVLAVAVVVLACLASGFSGRRRSAATRRPSALVRQLAGSGAPVSVVTGGAFVLERGRTSIAARSAAIGVAIGSAGLVAVAVFAASQGALEHTPARWGQVWDAEISLDSLDQFADADLVAINDVQATRLAINDRPVIVRSYASDGDPLMMVVSEGRPAGPGEVILGRQTMADLGVSIGDRVTLQGNLGETELEVVGQGVFSGVVDVPVIDEGAGVVAQTLAGITDPETDEHFGTWLARLGPGTELTDLAPAVAAADYTTEETAVRELTPVTPDEFDRLAEVRSLPWLLAVLLGVLAIATMTSMLIVTVRRQRRDLAVLRAVGIASGGVRRIVSVQSLVVSAMGLIVGVPLGIVIGRVAWMSVARGLGVVVHTSVPVLWLLAIVVAVIAVDLVSSLLPARSAARLHPAETLRSE